MKRAMGILGFLWLALRDRWFMSRWNPWGAAAGSARTMPTQDVMALIERQAKVWRNVATGTDDSGPTPPNRPIQ